MKHSYKPQSEWGGGARGFSPFKGKNCLGEGFTLAEVLITLGIIGVVAALTLPTVMANYRKKEVETKLAKIYSVMNQAINLNIAEHGDYKNWVKDCGGSNAPTCSSEEVRDWYNEYLGKHIKSTKVKIASVKAPTVDVLREGVLIYFADGSILFINNYIYDMYFYTDKKAISRNELGKSRFSFNFNPNNITQTGNTYNTTNSIKGFEPYSTSWDGTRENLINHTSYGCSTTNSKVYCAKLIQYEGWKIPDDYPIKF